MNYKTSEKEYLQILQADSFAFNKEFCSWANSTYTSPTICTVDAWTAKGSVSASAPNLKWTTEIYLVVISFYVLKQLF